MQEIFDYLDALIPNPKCELNFNCDYELLIAVVLSAQTTDKRVNEVTKVLFTKYPTCGFSKYALKVIYGQIFEIIKIIYKWRFIMLFQELFYRTAYPL